VSITTTSAGTPAKRSRGESGAARSGVCDRNLVTELRESPRERFTDHAGADDSGIHV
jgi:hypothetical protein